MSSRAPDLLSSIFSGGLQPKTPSFPGSMIAMKGRGPEDKSPSGFTQPVSKKRTAIWHMHPSVHCSIVGTCLSSAEIRRLLIKLGVHGAESASDHDLHKQGVALTGKPQGGGKFIQKALDHRHDAAIKQFAKAKDEGTLSRLSRLEAAVLAQSQAERARQGTQRECEGLRRELAVVEAQVSGWLAEDLKSAIPELAGAQVLYVGGRAHQVPQLKAVVERAGGALLYHDGGIEHSMTLLPGLISRADCAVFPIDCVSHDAMGILKRQCRQFAKPFIPLRTSSLASLLSGLTMLDRAQGQAVAVV